MIALYIFALLLSAVSARIVGFTTPKYPIHAGQTFPVTFQTGDSNWPSAQYYVLYGLAPKTTSPGDPSVIWSLDFGPGTDLVTTGHSNTDSATPGSFTVSLTLPSTFTSDYTDYVIMVAVLETVRALRLVVLSRI